MRTPRYPFLMTIVATFLAFSSCDDSDNPIIVGSWQLTKIVFSDCDDPEDNETVSESCTENSCDQITFYPNNTWESFFIDGNDQWVSIGYYTYNDGVVSMCVGDTDPCDDPAEIKIQFISGANFQVGQDAGGCYTTSTYKRAKRRAP